MFLNPYVELSRNCKIHVFFSTERRIVERNHIYFDICFISNMEDFPFTNVSDRKQQQQQHLQFKSNLKIYFESLIGLINIDLIMKA